MADLEDDLSGGIQPMFDDPDLPKGWSREVVQRKAGGRFEVSLLSPCGKKLKNRSELGAYLKVKKMKMKPEDFDFTVMGKNYVPFRSSRVRAASKTHAKPETKNPRGRPPKEAVKETPKGKNTSKTPKGKSTKAEPPPSGRRGRSRRSAAEEEQEEEEESEDEAPKPKAKGRRGRPSSKLDVNEEEEDTNDEEDTKLSSQEKALPKRGRTKPKRYESPESEPAPRNPKMKALFKDLDDVKQESPEEPATPSRGRGRPKKDEEPEKVAPASPKGKKTGAKKAKPKKRQVDNDHPDTAKNMQVLAEIEAELAEINGTKSGKRRPPKKRSGSSSNTESKPPAANLDSSQDMDNENLGDRPALEGFVEEEEEEEPIYPKRTRLESRSSERAVLIETSVSIPENISAEPVGVRRSTRAKKIDIPALLRDELDSNDEEEEIFAKPRKPKKPPMVSPGVSRPKPDRKRTKSARRRRTTSDEEEESIPLDSLEGAINSAASLLEDQSDSSGEQENAMDKPAQKSTQPKQSRSGRNVRSPRRPMENDFETDFSTLRRAMNATTSDFASRRRAHSKQMQQMGQYQMGTPYMDVKYEANSYEMEMDPYQDYLAQGGQAFKRTSETARTRTFEENKMEKTMTLMNPEYVNREPLLLETHLRAPNPPAQTALQPPKRQRKSSSQGDVRLTPTDNKVFYRKQKAGTQPGGTSLLKNMRIDTVSGSGEGVDPIESMLAAANSMVLTPNSRVRHDHAGQVSEMTPPPTYPIVPADDHSYSVSSRYLGDSATNAQHLNATTSGDDSFIAPKSEGEMSGAKTGVETRVMSIEQHDLLNQISAGAHASVAATAALASTAPAVVTGSGLLSSAVGAESVGITLQVAAASSAVGVSSAEGITVPISTMGVNQAPDGATPKEIIIYVGDKPTVVPVMQDESGMSVITLPNGIAEEDIQASLQASLQAAT